MKKQIILPILIGILLSCSSDHEIDPSDFDHEIDPSDFGTAVKKYPEKWQLIKMTGNIANVPPSTGSDMAWQEWYLFYSNHTFIKTRERNNVVTEAAGSYAIVTLSDGKYLELTYRSENDLIGNCTGGPTEFLKIKSDQELIGSWQICDGPGLFYKKVENNYPDTGV